VPIPSPALCAQAQGSAQELQLLEQLAAGQPASLQQQLLLLVANEVLAALAAAVLPRHSERIGGAGACRAQLQVLQSATRAAAQALAQLPAGGAGGARGAVQVPPAVVEAACLRRPDGGLRELLGMVAQLSGVGLLGRGLEVSVGGCVGSVRLGWPQRQPGSAA
jgi:hypothetical protein